MTATPKPARCHEHACDCAECGRCRRVLAKINAEIDHLNAILDARQRASHPADAPKKRTA